MADQKNKSTGPVTPEGKQASSRNATTHGCRSEKHAILPGESAEEFERIQKKWLREYPPSNEVDAELILRLAEREWHLRRCERNLDKLQTELMLRSPNPLDWTEAEQKALSLLTRYFTTADRTWRAAWRDIEFLRKGRIAEVRGMESAKRAVLTNIRMGIPEKLPIGTAHETDKPLPPGNGELPEKTDGRPPMKTDQRRSQ